jgi:hypothetical protein
MIDMDDRQRQAAWHEAGHAIVAFRFSRWINHEGIEIDRRPYSGLWRTPTSDTERAGVMIACAGWSGGVPFPRGGVAVRRGLCSRVNRLVRRRCRGLQ